MTEEEIEMILSDLSSEDERIIQTMLADGRSREEIADLFKDMEKGLTEIAIELGKLIYKQTNDAKFARDILMFMDTNAQRRELIEFIKKNNPTLNEINHRSFDIVMFGK